MIIVYKFASCSSWFDNTNLFGHAAISFTGLKEGADLLGGKDRSFAISQMKGGDDSNPTYTAASGMLKAEKQHHPALDRARQKAKETRPWEVLFFTKRQGHAFPEVIAKSFILSNETLEAYGHSAPRSGGLSERKAYRWWKQVIKTTRVMSQALDGSDCTDTVMKAIQASHVNPDTTYAYRRGLLRPFWTPSAAVEYAEAINDAIIRELRLSRNEVRTMLENDQMWRIANGNYDHSERIFDEKQERLDNPKRALLDDSAKKT